MQKDVIRGKLICNNIALNINASTLSIQEGLREGQRGRKRRESRLEREKETDTGQEEKAGGGGKRRWTGKGLEREK